MLKKALTFAAFLGLAACTGCETTDPVFYSWPHHKRRLRKIDQDLHEFHMDIDRIIFDLEPYPIEVDY